MTKTKLTKETPGSVHKALNLPSTYSIAISVEGNIDTHFHKVVTMLSSTGGHIAVYAEYTHVDGWVQIDKGTFTYRSMQLVHSLRDKKSENQKYIVEHGLEGLVPHAVKGANTVQDLTRYLDTNPHPFYRLASVSGSGDFTLVWERKEYKA